METKLLVASIVAQDALGDVTLALVFARVEVDAAGAMRFPAYRGEAVMDAVRDMMYDLGWRGISERATTATGQPTRATFSGIDQIGRTVTIDVVLGPLVGSAAVNAEDDGQFTRTQLTAELARRLGVGAAGAPLAAGSTRDTAPAADVATD
ncbi:MAG: hypothetical protein R3C10_09805 [Pirellulales bacterium]